MGSLIDPQEQRETDRGRVRRTHMETSSSAPTRLQCCSLRPAGIIQHRWASPGNFLVRGGNTENSRVWLTKTLLKRLPGQFVPRVRLPRKKIFLGVSAVCGSEQWVEEVGGIESSKTRAGHGNL